MERILEVLRERSDLPSMPEIIDRIEEKVQDSESKLEDIAQILKTDPVLVGRIIQLSNSAYYAISTNPVTDLKRAIFRLGLNEIRNLVYSLTLSRLFTKSQVIDQSSFWRHSLTVALHSQSLANVMGEGRRFQNQAYLAGLMHDVGIMVFGYLVPKSYSQFLDGVAGDITPGKNLELHTQEKQAFHLNHAELGAEYINYWWKFDTEIYEAIKMNHQPFNKFRELSTLSKIVRTADDYCKSKDITNGINAYRIPFEEDIFAQLGLSEKQTEQFKDISSISEEFASLIVSN